MARVLLGVVLLAAGALACAGSDGALPPAVQWRIRIAEVREWKLWIATAATALIAVHCLLRATGRAGTLRRSRDLLLLALALATLFAWWHPYRGSLRAWLHVGDAYHYYVGAKYFPELGYTRLYRCSVVADAEAGFATQVARSQIRNLETNALESAARALRDPEDCKRHFTPARWQSFQRDLQYFRKRLTLPLWFGLRVDHGYNPPPTWTVMGSLLTHTTETANRTQLLVLTALDPLLLAAMFGVIGWGFGWRAACIALVYWGTNQPANWEWVGGSIVRFDWLAASAAAIACLRRGHPVAAGLFCAWATGIRVFPAAIAGGVALAALMGMLRTRVPRPPADALRFGAAFALGLALLVGVSSAVVGSDAWRAFVENSRLHVSTDSMNRTGLRPLLAYRQETRLSLTLEPQAPDPYARWREARRENSVARRPLFFVAAAAHLALLAFALRRQPAWVAGLLGLGAVPVLLELGNYYYGFLLLYACLAPRKPDVAAALLGLSAISWWVGTWGGPDRDVVVARTSLAMIAFVAFVTLRLALAPEPEDREAPREAA